MKAIIFGVRGQDGFYLSTLLEQNNVEVIGISRSHGDVSDYSFVETVIKNAQPSYIFHFAANSTTRHEALFDNHRAISGGTINILESVRLHCPSSRVFLSGSAMQFENRELPIDEGTPFAGLSPYAVARIQSVYAGRYFRDVFGLRIYVGYFFNHDSPLRSAKHINQRIVEAAQRISRGSDEKLEIGDVNARKEFNFAGDVVRAVWILVNQLDVFEAVIGSGYAYSIKEWLQYCFQKVGRNWEEFVVQAPAYTPEYSVLVSRPELIKSLGWQPNIDFYQLADLMMAPH